MSQDSQITFTFPRPTLTGPQCRAQKTFVTRKITLYLPTLIIYPARKRTIHLAAILALGSWIPTATPIQRDNRQADAQFFPSQPVIGFRIKPRIGQQSVKGYIMAGLNQGRSKMRSIVIRTSADHTGTEQMRLNITYGGDLRPAGVAMGTFVPTSLKVMTADMMIFQARRINGSFGLVRKQAQSPGSVKNRLQEAFKSPFFSSFCSA